MANDFLPFADANGANVLTQAQYAALTAIVANGFQSGVADSPTLNKVWRQSSVMAYVLAQMIADTTGLDVLDNGDNATLLANLKAAVSKGKLIGVRTFTATAAYTPTQGTTNVIVEVQAGGGAGAGAGATAAGTIYLGNGGAGGGYASSRLVSGFTGLTAVVGSGGAGGSSTGVAGGASSFGPITASGGNGGDLVSFNSFPNTFAPALSGLGSGGNLINGKGGQGVPLLACSVSNFYSGSGGFSHYGAGGLHATSTTQGGDSVSYGAGGGGAAVGSSGTAKLGGSGKSGIIVIWEYA